MKKRTCLGRTSLSVRRRLHRGLFGLYGGGVRLVRRKERAPAPDPETMERDPCRP